MNRISNLKKLLAIVALLLILPAVMPGFEGQMCEPGECPANCEGGYDCTSAWIMESWYNMQIAMAIWMAGYNLVVCCS